MEIQKPSSLELLFLGSSIKPASDIKNVINQHIEGRDEEEEEEDEYEEYEEEGDEYLRINNGKYSASADATTGTSIFKRAISRAVTAVTDFVNQEEEDSEEDEEDEEEEEEEFEPKNVNEDITNTSSSSNGFVTTQTTDIDNMVRSICDETIKTTNIGVVDDYGNNYSDANTESMNSTKNNPYGLESTVPKVSGTRFFAEENVKEYNTVLFSIASQLQHINTLFEKHNEHKQSNQVFSSFYSQSFKQHRTGPSVEIYSFDDDDDDEETTIFKDDQMFIGSLRTLMSNLTDNWSKIVPYTLSLFEEIGGLYLEHVAFEKKASEMSTLLNNHLSNYYQESCVITIINVLESITLSVDSVNKGICGYRTSQQIGPLVSTKPHTDVLPVYCNKLDECQNKLVTLRACIEELLKILCILKTDSEQLSLSISEQVSENASLRKENTRLRSELDYSETLIELTNSKSLNTHHSRSLCDFDEISPITEITPHTSSSLTVDEINVVGGLQTPKNLTINDTTSTRSDIAITTANNTIKTLKDEITSLHERIEKYEQAISESEISLIETKTINSELNYSISSLSQQQQEHIKIIANLESDLSSKDEEILTMRRRLTELQIDNQQKGKQLAVLEKSHEELKSAYSKASKKADKIIDETIATINSVRQDNSGKPIVSSEFILNDSILKVQLDEKSMLCKSLLSDNQTLKQQHIEIVQQLTRSEQQNMSLHLEKFALSNSLKDLKSRIVYK